MKYLTTLSIALVAGLSLAANESVPTPAQFAVVDAHLKEIGVMGEIPREYVNVQVVSKPGEGQIALAVLYTHERPSGSGNDYHRRLAVFLRAGSGLSAPIDVIAGGAARRSLTLREVAPDRVVLDAVNYAPQDAVCCPSIPGLVTYLLSERTLVEAGNATRAVPSR